MAVEAGGIGARLRAGREKLGLTVLQVAERIHTDPKIVDAIEAENYETLGAPVYARGHIRHYADLVGESANELVQIYSNLAKVGHPDLTRIVKAPAGPDSSKLVAPALVVVAVFAVAGAIWWISALSKKKPQMSETHVVTDEAAASATPPAETPPAESAAASPPPTERAPSSNTSSTPPQRPGAAVSSGVASAPRSAGGNPTRSAPAAQPVRAPTLPAARPTSTRTPPSPASTATRTASSTPPAAAAPPTRTAAATPAPEAPPAPRPKNQSSVTLRYSADSWTEVYDASGARLFYDVGAANSVQTVVGTPPLRVVLGNASGVSVEYNGHSKPIAKLSRPDGSVQFSITRSGEVVRAKPVADGG